MLYYTVLELNLIGNNVTQGNPMGTPIEYLSEKGLQWQPSFNGQLGVLGHSGYRGDLMVTEGKIISGEKQMPPKIILKHVIAISDEKTMLLFAGGLKSFDDFPAFFERYKEILDTKTIVTLFVDDLLSDAQFDFEGITVHAFSLDESSVWNELINHADLDKRELKRMSAEDKLDTLYDGLKANNLQVPKLTYESTCALKMG